MHRVLVWSWAVRVLHAVFAGSLSFALVAGFVLGERHAWFPLHGLAGLLAAGALALRLVLGFVGAGHARFTSWPVGPHHLARYWGELKAWRREPGFVGHNPAAAWAMIGMFVVAAGLIATGLAGGEDLHEGLAGVLVALIGLHLAGLALHTVRHREPIAWSMWHGRKLASAGAGLKSPGLPAGVAVLMLIVGWGLLLGRGYDARSATVRLPAFSRPIPLAEAEHGGGERRSHGERSEHDDD